MKPTKRQIQIVEHFVKKVTKKIMNEAVAGYIETYVDGKQMLGSDGTRVLQNLNTRSVSTIMDQQIKNITSLSKNVKTYLKDAEKIELRVVTKSGSIVKKLDITSKVQG
jgi:hypothetical protein